jgi:uncharacterized membrane protein
VKHFLYDNHLLGILAVVPLVLVLMAAEYMRVVPGAERLFRTRRWLMIASWPLVVTFMVVVILRFVVIR